MLDTYYRFRSVIESTYMPYTHFRFIAYELPTAVNTLNINPLTGEKDVVSGFSRGNACAPVPRIPVPVWPELDHDATTRLMRLAAVVDLAEQQLQVLLPADDANTLKIFVAPEFYFRPPSTLGLGYAYNTYPAPVAKFIKKAFGEMFIDAAFKDWLIIGGTVLWNDQGLVNGNTMIGVRGGPRNYSLITIEKREASTIDGVNSLLTPSRVPGLKIEHNSCLTMIDHIVDIDNVKIGFEVCLDHLDNPACRILRQVRSYSTLFGPHSEVDLHVLTAGGMKMSQNSIAANANGYFMRNDGFSDAPRSELRQVERYSYPNAGMPNPQFNNLTTSNPYFPGNPSHAHLQNLPVNLYGIPLAGAMLADVDDPVLNRPLEAPPPQQLAIYNPLPLPRRIHPVRNYWVDIPVNG